MVSSRCEVFVSYRSSQRPIAAALDEALRSRGYSTFFDRRNIGDFDSVDATLESALRGALLVLSVFSADYLESMPCNAELLFALNAHNGAQVAGDASAGRSRLRIANPESDKHHLVDMPLAGHTVNVAPLTDKTDAVAVELWANIVAAELAPHIEQLRAAGSQPLSLYFSLTGTLELGMNELRPAQTAQALFATADPQQHLQHALLGRDRQALGAHQQLHGSVGNSILHPANLPGSLVVHGLPGVGKTSFGQLLARRFHWSYPGGVFAFDAVGYPLDVASSTGVATAMAPQDTQYEALKRMLIRFTSISSDAHQAVTAQVGDLSLFDRVEGRGRLRPAMTAAWSTLEGPYLWWVDDPPPNTGADYFRQWQPPTEKGLFLVTQRDLPPDAWAANVMALDCLKVGAARTLLTRNTPPQGPNEVQAAAAILTALDGHPLGLHAAANQIRRQ